MINKLEWEAKIKQHKEVNKITTHQEESQQQKWQEKTG